MHDHLQNGTPRRPLGDLGRMGSFTYLVMLGQAIPLARSRSQRGATRADAPRIRPCLHCRALHDHHNAFCSADCCRAHRLARRTPTS